MIQFCLHCSNSFHVSPARLADGRGKYCSKACQKAAQPSKTVLVCHQCGVSFTKNPSQTPHTGSKFCSWPCYLATQPARIACICGMCGKAFNLSPSAATKAGRGQYCSRACRHAAARIEKVCLHCHVSFHIPAARDKDDRGKFCSKRCLKASQSIVKEQICQECGAHFLTRAYFEAQYCSHACYQATYRRVNAEGLREKNAAKYAENKEEILRKHAQYRITHPEQRRNHYITHREEQIEKARQWAKEHPEQVLATVRARHKEHPEIHRAQTKRRRARKANAAINDFTHTQWFALQEAFNHRCAYCGKRAKGHLTQDHITPLSKGGNHTLSNIVPACRSCNGRKFTGPPPTPVQPFLLL